MDINMQDLALLLGQQQLQILDLQGKNAQLQAALTELKPADPANTAQTAQ